ncbi:MAG TPA: DedA family protein, partial [Exiguobacterium sp.]|nr:DedA family protein [Exiguobacterium sp.]
MSPIHHLLHDILHQYGALGLSVLLAGGIVGLPVPDETLLVLSGFWMHQGNLPLVGTILA